MKQTDVTTQKRQQLLEFIDTELQTETAVQAVIGVGSIAKGTMRPNSDIDAIVFLDPYDLYIVPAESKWHLVDRTYRSIFTDGDGCLQLDFMRFDLAEWSTNETLWTDGQRAGLQDAWFAFERDDRVRRLVEARLVYSDATRIGKLDQAINGLEQHLKWDKPADLWESLEPAEVHDRLRDAYGHLVRLLFAYNHRWQPWSDREMSHLLRLPWLPQNFSKRIMTALNAPSHDFNGFVARFDELLALFDEVLTCLAPEEAYGQDPIGRAFTRLHNEPGRAQNMDEWNKRHSAPAAK